LTSSQKLTAFSLAESIAYPVYGAGTDSPGAGFSGSQIPAKPGTALSRLTCFLVPCFCSNFVRFAPFRGQHFGLCIFLP